MITLYSLSYTQEVYKAKVNAHLKLFSALVMPFLRPLVKELFNNGVFLALIEDLHNQGQCQASFLLNQGIEIPLKLSTERCSPDDEGDEFPKLIIEVNAKHKVTLHAPKRTREILRSTAEKAGHDWGMIENYVVTLVKEFYKENFVFVEMDEGNAESLRKLFGYVDDVGLLVRVKAATPQKA